MKWWLLFLVSGLLLVTANANAAELCWHNDPAATQYVMEFQTIGGPSPVSMGIVLEEYTTDIDQVNHWTIPEGTHQGLVEGEFTVWMHKVMGVKITAPWRGASAQFTDFDCSAPVTLPSPRVFGDVTCDGEISVSDALRVLRWALLLEPAMTECP